MKPGLFSFVMFLTLSLLGPVAYGETLILGAEDDWIPYSRPDGTGISNDIIKAAYQSVGINVQFQVMPYSRILKMVEWGELPGGFNVPLDEESKKNFLFGKTPLYEAVSAYYQSTAKPLKAKSREQLIHKERVGVVLGYGYGDHFLEAVRQGKILKEDSTSESINLKKLDAGRLDATIIYDKTAAVLIRDLRLQGKIEMAFPNETSSIFVGFSPKNTKARYYADKLDEGLANIKKNGTYSKILASY